ncbi:RNA methyltransferase [Halosquirtibacter xylanolyticus]|uniref:TrmH family RNA methyltransferase n=1 Tax=Halosquirtibacter xylanolyticus TaxID=3374599 RepID=UPI003748BA04|nr:RNA methyltransferase [Prolixibacteraceae bacterium]
MEELSKNRIKYIKSLSQKKYRKQEKHYIAEGAKIIEDLILANHPIKIIYAAPEAYDKLLNLSQRKNITLVETSIKSIEKASHLTTPSNAIALMAIEPDVFSIDMLHNKITIALDNIQDPGNLGTIIRIADWFGIDNIICSKDTVDVYNNKVIQSTMGAIARVKVYYDDLHHIIDQATQNNINIFGTFLDGKNIYSEELPKQGIVVMGNEGKGISESIESLVTNKITIPSFRQEKGSESLNVAMATSIICSEFMRR